MYDYEHKRMMRLLMKLFRANVLSKEEVIKSTPMYYFMHERNLYSSLYNYFWGISFP